MADYISERCGGDLYAGMYLLPNVEWAIDL